MTWLDSPRSEVPHVPCVQFGHVAATVQLGHFAARKRGSESRPKALRKGLEGSSTPALELDGAVSTSIGCAHSYKRPGDAPTSRGMASEGLAPTRLKGIRPTSRFDVSSGVTETRRKQ